MDNIKILFLASEPSDYARLKLGQELREIREKLRLSKQRDKFLIESRESVRPSDISQAIFDIEPQIVHFSGHGTKKGELCFEDILGKATPVRSDALARLFGLVSDQVNCVILNACYSEVQAKAIAEHIQFVVGMPHTIGDSSAITFAVGFYKALGAGRSFEDAYKFANVEIQLANNMPEYLTPVLHINKNKAILTDNNSKRTKYILVLSATIDEINKPLIEAIVAHLRQVSGDTSLTLQQVESGSIKLVLEGAVYGFKRLNFLFKEGKLNNILGIAIQDIQRWLAHIFHCLFELFNELIAWLGKICADFIKQIIDKLQLIWENKVCPVLFGAFGNTPILYTIFYAGENIGETIMEVWDPKYVSSKSSQVFLLKQFPINNPLPKLRQDAKVLVLENWYY